MTDKKETTPVVKALTEGDLIWNELKGKKMSLFGMTVPVVDHVERLQLMPSQLSLKVKIPAVVSMLDEVLNVVRWDGGEKRIERFNVETSKSGIVNITRINDAT